MSGAGSTPLLTFLGVGSLSAILYINPTILEAVVSLPCVCMGKHIKACDYNPSRSFMRCPCITYAS